MNDTRMDEKAQRIALSEWFGSDRDIESLDVLHEMRQKLTPDQQMAYTTHRWKICRRATGHIVTDHDMWRFANTNAEQEREALLRAVGLWRD